MGDKREYNLALYTMSNGKRQVTFFSFDDVEKRDEAGERLSKTCQEIGIEVKVELINRVDLEGSRYSIIVHNWKGRSREKFTFVAWIERDGKQISSILGHSRDEVEQKARRVVESWQR